MRSFYLLGALLLAAVFFGGGCTTQSCPLGIVLSGEATYIPLPTQAYSASSINVSFFRRHGIITKGACQWVAYFGPVGQVIVAKRALPHGIWLWREFENGMPARMIGDGHQSINIGYSSDDRLHLIWGAHGTCPRYLCLNPSTLERIAIRSPFADDETASYPQFHEFNKDLILIFRNDRTEAIDWRGYRATPDGWCRDSNTVLLKPLDVESIYLNTPAINNSSWALAYTLRRWTNKTGALPPPIVNEHLRVVFSENGGREWRLPDGGSRTAPILADVPQPVLEIPAGRNLMNQCGGCFDENGVFWFTFLATDANGEFYVNVAHIKLGEARAHTEVLKRTGFHGELRGMGTLTLPVSRPAIGHVLDSHYVLFRMGNEIHLFLSDNKHDGTKSWRETVIARGDFGSWEPVVDDSTDYNQPLRFYLQRASQMPEDHVGAAGASDAGLVEIHLSKTGSLR